MAAVGKILLSTAYLPNIQYISKLLSGNPVCIELHDTYAKQSYRNRAVIFGANGPLDLVIPVKKPNGNRTKTIEVELDYDMPWMQVHWKALVSAYKHSPFFKIFEAELKPLYHSKQKLLSEWNRSLLEALFMMLGEDLQIEYSTEYTENTDNSFLDLREGIHPKKRLQKPDPDFRTVPYYQVFAEKHGFAPNLSFIDLIFNEGPNALMICRQSIQKGNI